MVQLKASNALSGIHYYVLSGTHHFLCTVPSGYGTKNQLGYPEIDIQYLKVFKNLSLQILSINKL